jgi:hypothetical protein
MVFSSTADSVFRMEFSAGIFGVLFCLENRLVPLPFPFVGLGDSGIFGVTGVT